MTTLSEGEFYNKHPILCFVADKNFYADFCKTVGFKERMARDYIKRLINSKILKVIKTLEGNVRVLSFGYYTQWDGRDKHNPYLIENPHYKRVLRDFRVK